MAKGSDSIPHGRQPLVGSPEQVHEGLPSIMSGVDGSYYRGADVTGKVAREPGVKLDQGKPKYFQNVRWQFGRALKALAHHTEKGNSEPGHVPCGWKVVEDGYVRYTEALERHLHEEAMRYCVNSASDPQRIRREVIEHATAVLWNAAARLEHLLAGGEE